MGIPLAIAGIAQTVIGGVTAYNAQKQAAAAAGRAGPVQAAMSDAYTGDILPRYQQEVGRYFSPEYEAEQRALAEGDYRRGVTVADQARRRSGLAMGLRPEDIVTQGQGTSARMATGLADASNRAGTGVRRARMGVLGPGLAMGPQSANIALGQASTYGNQARTGMGMLNTGLDLAGSAGGNIMKAAGSIWGGGAPKPYKLPPYGGYTAGGVGSGFAEGGYVEGPGDETSDSIPAVIDGQQPAALSDGEFVVPADVVDYLGPEYLAALIQQVRAAMAEGIQGEPRRIGGSTPQQEGPRRMAAPPAGPTPPMLNAA